MHSFLDTLADLMKKNHLPGLLVGGHAVTALGHARATFDVDFLIPRDAAEKWKIALTGLSYRMFAESANFHQYEPVNDFPLPPIDLMLVDTDVYDVLERKKNNTQPIPVPHVESMIALKLHAAKQQQRTDAEKDWSDIVALCRAHKLDLDNENICAMILRHGGESALKRIKAAFSGGY